MQPSSQSNERNVAQIVVSTLIVVVLVLLLWSSLIPHGMRGGLLKGQLTQTMNNGRRLYIAGYSMAIDHGTTGDELLGWAASDPSQVAWEFFDLAASGRSREALDLAAPILRSRLDAPRLEAALGRLELKSIGQITWKKGRMFSDMATAEGTYAPKPGRVTGLIAVLVRDGENWRLYSASTLPDASSGSFTPLFAPVGPASGAQAPAVPDEKTTRELVLRDLRYFAAMQESTSFRDLYERSGGRARKGRVPGWEMLARIHDRELNAGMALDPSLHSVEPAKIGPDGICVANARVEISPLQFRTSYLFVLGPDGWKEAGRDGGLVPDARDLERLSREALLAFDAAVRRRSFAEFHKRVSNKWKQQVTPEQMEVAFRDFVEKQMKVEGLASAPIKISSGPDEDRDGVLLFSGQCETKPVATHFSLKYWHEDGQWRLLGIDVSLRKPK
jgi:hypothetical protein